MSQMALKNRIIRTVFNRGLFLAVFLSILFNPISALAWGGRDVLLPGFNDFSEAVQNGKADNLRGVYVANVLALPVVQQPAGNAGYVSNSDGQVTQFALASQYENIGLLAHNHLSGRFFSQLAVGQEVRLVYGDGKVETFIVTEVLQYQALQPNSPWSSFRSLADDTTLSAGQMFKRVYAGDHHVTFQTCIYADGNASWGRLFIIATPKDNSLTQKSPWFRFIN
jgi:hypothetical protein